MTDERMGDALWRALARLPRGGGIVFRHYATPLPERRALFAAVRRIARRRGLVLILAGTVREACGWRADGAHARARHRMPHRAPGRARARMLRTAPAHDARDLAAACAARVDVVFLSPVFPTRSHPGARALEPVRFGMIARSVGKGCRPPRLIALGGMTARGYRRLRMLGADGWAAIDALSTPLPGA